MSFLPKSDLFRAFVRCSSLSVLGTLGVSCYILADTFFIARALGTNGLAALNLAIPVFSLVYGIGLMLGMGGATKFSICKSQRDQRQVDLIYSNVMLLGAVFAVFFTALGALFAKQIAALLGADASILEMTTIYLRWLLLFSPAFLFNNILLCFVRNDDGPQLTMAAMVIGSFANIVFDYLFIFPLQMGIFGAILATVFSPVISILIMLLHWIRRKNSFHFRKTRLYGGLLLQAASLGFPSLLAQLSSGVVMLVFNMLLLRLSGNTGVAGYGVIANIALVVTALYNGIAQGVQPLASDFYGQRRTSDIAQLLRYSLITAAVVSAIVYLILFLNAAPITAIFNSERNAALQGIAETGLKLYFTSNFFVGYNTILSIFLTSTERAIPTHLLSLLRGLVLIIPLAFMLSAFWGMTGVWLAYPVTEAVTAALGWYIYRTNPASQH